MATRPQFSFKKPLESAESIDGLLHEFQIMKGNLLRNDFSVNIKPHESVEETLDAFMELKAFSSEKELFDEQFIVVEKLFKLNAFHQVLEFGKKLYRNLVLCRRTCEFDLLIVDVLHLLGAASFNIKQYEDCLKFLNGAKLDLRMVLRKGSFQLDDNSIPVLNTFMDIEMDLYQVKWELGYMDDAVVNALNVLEIQKSMFKDISPQIGLANLFVCKAYSHVWDYVSALPFGLKALDIFQRLYGTRSVEVAEARRILAVIFQDRGEYCKSFELNRLAVTVLRETSPGTPDLLIAEIEGAYTLIEWGWYEEAVDAMKGLFSRAGIVGWLRLKSCLTMAKALCCLRNFEEAEEYIGNARRMLEETEIDDPVFVPLGFVELALLYQNKNDLESATLMIKRGLEFPGIPQKLLLRCLKDAKRILDATLGPHHLDSLKTSQTLAETYATLRSYDLAVDIQKKVVEGLTELGPSEQEKLDKAVSLLEKMKVAAAGASCENCAVESSKCGAAEDGNAS